MPSSLTTIEDDLPVPDRWPGDLESLRNKIDDLDDAIHDLLIRRAAVVAEVATAKPKGGRLAFRPGREAAILRRLLARHHGGLPPNAIVRIWRELFAATTSMQGSFVVAVGDTERSADLSQVAREHFGALTPMRNLGSAAQAIAELSAGRASVAVFPLPSEDEPSGSPWWTALFHNEPRIYMVARLPFWAPRRDGMPSGQALVAAASAPDRSGDDRTLLGLEIDVDTSRGRLSSDLQAAGLPPEAITVRRHPGAATAQAMAEITGFLIDDDSRFAKLRTALRAPVVLGAYATPIGNDQ